ncbi:MAG: TIGR01777 family oxidoreductase [Thermoanaerobaculia bacterium]|nr:TIGR01777 family oxidoreductase [Thermoanaerobaculia bacterium]
MAERIVLTGGSGLIGRALTQELAREGREVVVASRAPGRVAGLPAGARAIGWEELSAAVDGAAAVVNLAGEPIAGGRWTEERKRRIVESRRRAADACLAALAAARRRPPALLQASAVGYYGARGDEELAEDSPRGEGFLAETTAAWEAASAGAEALGVRRVLLRTGVVLDPRGGALAKMLPPFRLGLGGPLGSGRQWMPWIHRDDQVAAIRFLLDRADLGGPFLLVAPAPVRNREFGRALGRALARPALLPAPALALRLLFGEMAEVVLGGQRARPGRLLAAGFAFRFPELDGALTDLLGRGRTGAPAGRGPAA